jgi:hypothetical protein
MAAAESVFGVEGVADGVCVAAADGVAGAAGVSVAAGGVVGVAGVWLVLWASAPVAMKAARAAPSESFLIIFSPP